MSIESGESKEERREFPLAQLPEGVAEDFLNGKLEEHFPVVNQDAQSSTYRCFEKEVDLPRVGLVTLQADYRVFDDHGSSPEKFQQMRFEYTKPGETKKEKMVGEVHLFVDPIESQERPYDFNMKHREVNEEYRRTGIGRAVYEQAESWVKQVATKKGESITIAASPAQADVIKWLTKLGYTPYPEDQEIYDHWVAHPEDFDTQTVDQGMNDFGDHIIRENVLFKRDDATKQAVRIWMKKSLPPLKQ